MTIWTIGHSTHSIEQFIAMLKGHEIEFLADVRKLPGSRAYPHFNAELLAQSLAEAGIEYFHLPELGGRRRPDPASPNTAWRSSSFRGYADYMETEEFQAGIARLLDASDGKRAAIMCAEVLWWRCHRALIADYLKVRGIDVIHITSPTAGEPHPFTTPARILDGRLVYGEEGVPAREMK